MEGEQQDLRTPLLLASAKDAAKDDDNGLKHDEDNDAVPPMESTISQATFPAGGGVIKRGVGGQQQQQTLQNSSLGEEGSSTSSKAKQEQVATVADLRIVLVYGQWIWPLIPFSGLTNLYSLNDQWALAMFGNALMLAALLWISTLAPPSANTTEITNQHHQQQLRRYEILPTILWGITPLLPEYGGVFGALFLLILLLFFIFVAVRIKRYGCQATMNQLFHSFQTAVCNRCAIFSEHLVSFKHLEEGYFEQLKEQEDEESRLLMAQQERLAYLEDGYNNGQKKKGPRMWPVYIFILLSGISFCSLIYNYAVLLPIFGSLSKTVVKSHRAHMYESTVMNIRPSRVQNITSISQWEKLALKYPWVFVHFYAPWAIHSKELVPIWDAFSVEASRKSIPLVVAQVDCVTTVALKDLCSSLKIRAFPTLRWYSNGKADPGDDYKGARNVNALLAYTKQKLVSNNLAARGPIFNNNEVRLN
mmetsp:Transcript_15072/g.21982  ORF Transcript_15072/g.21982 Transcript_15072/m.21982 type:complete len:476 (+) Transcript_15072:106-1533(+)